MSRKVPEERYRKTFSYKFRCWLEGTKDPFLGQVEMEPREPFVESEAARERREEDRALLESKVYDLEHNFEMRVFRRFYRVFSVLFCIFLVAMLLVAVSDLPAFGHGENPANNEVAQRYIEKGLEETGAVNIVTGMILDYRAFDTFGESNVLFLAVICVVMLLKRDSKNISAAEDQENAEDDVFDMEDLKLILKKGSKTIAPLVILYGIYVVLNGHLSPGGGFSGGSIIGAGLILYSAANGQKKMQTFFTFRTFTLISVACLLTYCGCKSYSFFTGANHVGYEIPKGVPGAILSSGFILPLNICVGLIVACTMYGFYALFTKGEI